MAPVKAKKAPCLSEEEQREAAADRTTHLVLWNMLTERPRTAMFSLHEK